MKKITTVCILALLFTSCAHLRNESRPEGIARYASLLCAIGEPVDIRAEMWSEYGEYTRFLYIPSFSQPICITVRGGSGMPGGALMRTRVIQRGRGIPMSKSWEPDYTREIFCSDATVDFDTYTELLIRISDLQRDTSARRPPEFGGFDGECCVLEHAAGTNDYFFLEVWSPDSDITDDLKDRYREAWPDKTVDFDNINDFLRRAVNALNWFAKQTKFEEFQRYGFREESFQQDERIEQQD